MSHDPTTLLKRLTLIVREGVVETRLLSGVPPDTHASLVLEWLQRQNGADAR